MVRSAIRSGVACLALTALVSSAPLTAQVGTEAPALVAGAPQVTLQRITIHSPAIAGNLEGESAERRIIVVLPPSYRKEPKRRYPVVYALHGYSIDPEQWITEIRVPQTVQGAFGKGAREMIVVLPDSKTIYNGSMYSSSPTTGDFENFVARDVVAYIDGHYRTLARRESRGLVGHSMGGYGATRIGMKHADVFGALYLMSACCLSARDAGPVDAKASAAFAALKSPADSTNLDFIMRAQLAVAAAWSPNPKNPPLYLDLPVKEGVVQKDVLAKWAANAPLSFVDQYIGNLRRYRAIAMDVGDQDGLRVDQKKLHEVLESYGIANSFEVYLGTHTSHVAYRFQDHVLPFFSKNLEFGAKR